VASIVSADLLEDELRAVVRAGGYGSEKEAVGHALGVLLAANPHLRTSAAVELYRAGKVTLSRGAEIAGLDLEASKERLAERNVPILVEEPPEDVRAGAETIRGLWGTR